MSSVTVTASDATAMPSYPASLLVTLWRMVTLSSSASASATPDTTKICARFQPAGVKVYDAGATVAAPSSLLATVTVTGAVGRRSRDTVYDARPSSATRSVVGVTVTPPAAGGGAAAVTSMR